MFWFSPKVEWLPYRRHDTSSSSMSSQISQKVSVDHYTFLTWPPTPKFCLNVPYMFKNRKITFRGHQCVDLAQNNRETSELSKSWFSINLSPESIDNHTVLYMFKFPKITFRGHQCVHLAKNNRETSQLSISRLFNQFSLEKLRKLLPYTSGLFLSSSLAYGELKLWLLNS